jgi:hypothetical protein
MRQKVAEKPLCTVTPVRAELNKVSRKLDSGRDVDLEDVRMLDLPDSEDAT